MTASQRPIPPLPLKWWEGMLLAPQHMQQQGLRQDMLLAYQAGLLTPCAYGLVSLQSSADAAEGVIGDGQLSILNLQAILPDGTQVAHGPGAPASLSLALGSALPATEGASARLYLALPRRHAGDVAPVSGARFLPVVDSAVADENSDADRIELTRLAPALSLTIGPPPGDRFVGMPILVVGFSNGAYRVRDYVPPSLLAALGERLHGLCAGLADRVRQTATGLTGLAGLSTTDWRAPLAAQAAAELRALAGALPAFEAMVQGPAQHPYRLYLGLCGLAGQAAAAAPGTLPPRFGSYDHDDPLPCFQAVADFVTGLLAGLGGATRMVPFEPQEDGFRLTMEAAWLSAGITIGVLPGEGQSHHAAQRYMESCLIGGGKAMLDLRRRRVLGAARRKLPEAEALSLARRPDMAVYRLSDCPVEAGEALEIGSFQAEEAAPPPATIVLFLPLSGGN